jgi:hypothetical protein
VTTTALDLVPVQIGNVSIAHAAETDDGKPRIVQYGAVRWNDGTVTWGSVQAQPGSPNALTFKADRQTISGLCGTGSHHLCPGLVAQPRSGGKVQVAMCGCACQHDTLATDVVSRITVGGYRCTKCSARKPLLQHLHNDPGLDRIDPRTGACVDRETCGQLVAHKLDTSPLRALSGRNTVPKTDGPDGAAPAEKPARTPRVKEGRCEHCGSKTNGGKFTPGHDAQLKSALIKTYADVNAKSADRVGALAEAIARGWLKNRSAHDIRPLMKGVKEDEAKREIASDFDKLVEQADALVTKDSAEVVIKRRVAERMPASA